MVRVRSDDFLTQNPEVWRKTIFLLTYDENDGYFDHIPPFVAPHPRKPETGMTAGGIKTDADFVTMEEELSSKRWKNARESSIGLGYRVPLVIASPWSRGGFVCSQVFDHTSPIQFLEKLLSKKLGRSVQESNISDWRRAVCGDLTSSFRPYNGEKTVLPPFLHKEPFVESIHKAQFKPVPAGFKALSATELQEIKSRPAVLDWRLRQEPGSRPACALPYELNVDGAINPETKLYELTFAARSGRFGSKTAGAAFNVYAPGNHKTRTNNDSWERCRAWNFALPAGGILKYNWSTKDFEAGLIFLRVYGPNGFFREFQSDAQPPITVRCDYQGDFEVILVLTNNNPAVSRIVEISDNAYGAKNRTQMLAGGEQKSITLSSQTSSGWYDFTVRTADDSKFLSRFAGHLENGKDAVSDPVIGRAA